MSEKGEEELKDEQVTVTEEEKLIEGELSSLPIDTYSKKSNKKICIVRGFFQSGLFIFFSLLIIGGIILYEKFVRESNVYHVIIPPICIAVICIVHYFFQLVISYIFNCKCK